MFIYEENTLGIEDIKSIRQAVKWRMFTDHQLQQALNMTVYSIGVKDNEKAIVMGRLIGDGIYYLICDVAVMPDYQNQGIGTKIIQCMIQYVQSHLQKEERCSLQLIAAKGKESFYESLGFSLLPNDLSGHGMQMFMKNDDEERWSH